MAVVQISWQPRPPGSSTTSSMPCLNFSPGRSGKGSPIATRRLSGPLSVNSIQPTLSVAKSNKATRSSITSSPLFVPSHVERSTPPSLPLIRIVGRNSPPPVFKPNVPIFIHLSALCALCRHLAAGWPIPFFGKSHAEDRERVLTRSRIGEVEGVGIDGDQARQLVRIGADGEEVLQRGRHTGQGRDMGSRVL